MTEQCSQFNYIACDVPYAIKHIGMKEQTRMDDKRDNKMTNKE
jgi:hypothetical protein